MTRQERFEYIARQVAGAQLALERALRRGDVDAVTKARVALAHWQGNQRGQRRVTMGRYPGGGAA